MEDDQLTSDIEFLKEVAASPTELGKRLHAVLPYLLGTTRHQVMKRSLRLQNTSPLRFEVGTLAADESAILGAGGHVFLYRGSNNVISLYDPNRATKDLEIGKKYAQLSKDRRARITSLGGSYVQIAIPDPISVLSDKFPRKIQAPSNVFNAFTEDFQEADWFLNGYNHLFKQKNRTETFRKVDTHMTAYGAWCIFRAFLEMIGHGVIHDPAFVPGDILGGDLSRRLSSFPAYEQLNYPEAAFTAQYEKSLEVVDQHRSITGHTGSFISFKNMSAPINRRLLVFGGSSFEFGNKPMALSWWAARWFREFKFVWSFPLDYNIIEDYRPDLVVGQTIERFLRRVPAT